MTAPTLCEWPLCVPDNALSHCRHDPTADRCPLLATPHPTPELDEDPGTLLGIAPPTDDEDPTP